MVVAVSLQPTTLCILQHTACWSYKNSSLSTVVVEKQRPKEREYAPISTVIHQNNSH